MISLHRNGGAFVWDGPYRDTSIHAAQNFPRGGAVLNRLEPLRMTAPSLPETRLILPIADSQASAAADAARAVVARRQESANIREYSYRVC